MRAFDVVVRYAAAGLKRPLEQPVVPYMGFATKFRRRSLVGAARLLGSLVRNAGRTTSAFAVLQSLKPHANCCTMLQWERVLWRSYFSRVPKGNSLILMFRNQTSCGLVSNTKQPEAGIALHCVSVTSRLSIQTRT